MIDTEFGLLLYGVLLILVVAWAGSALLRLRFSPDGKNAMVENLAARVGAWWAIAALLALAMLGGAGGVVILFGIISFAALREFLTLTAKSRADHWARVQPQKDPSESHGRDRDSWHCHLTIVPRPHSSLPQNS